SNPEKSKRPPTRRNSRTSAVNSCCSVIQSESVEGLRATIFAWPSGEAAYARSNSRRASNSSTRAELWMSGEDIEVYVTGTLRCEAACGDARLQDAWEIT